MKWSLVKDRSGRERGTWMAHRATVSRQSMMEEGNGDGDEVLREMCWVSGDGGASK